MAPRQYKSNNAGENELKAHAAENSGTAKAKKQWDVFANTDVGKDGKREDSKMVAAFQIRGGKSGNGDKPYLFLSGFSKEIGSGLSISLTTKAEKLVNAMIDAGLDETVCKVLEARGILK